jgi:hypothetical protein
LNLGWLTDPHLDHLDEHALLRFIDELAEAKMDGLLISGDIGESHTVIPLLQRLDAALTVPIWFVLGNHDYYGGDITDTRERVRAWSRQSQRTRWLPDCGVVPLTPTTALAGHGGWADGRCGNFQASSIQLNDYLRIEDLVCPHRETLQRRLMSLGDEAALFTTQVLEEAFADFENVIFLTHVPPYQEACWYQGQTIVNEWTPHFTCLATGWAMNEVLDRQPDRALHVLCGHTHNVGTAQLRTNLRVDTGGAEYGAPALQRPILIA